MRAVARELLWRLKNNRLISWIRSRFKWSDDFRWDTYTRVYKDQITYEVDPYHTTQLSKVRCAVTKGRITLFDNAKPIHPNHLLIYERALALEPVSILEFGFGGGDHLANLRLLFPRAKIGGVDIRQTQLVFALERNQTGLINAWLDVRDMTQPNAAEGIENWAEFVFSQAVVMHIHGGRRHKLFMSNMWKVSSRYILLMENWVWHNFVKDLRAMFPASNLYAVSASNGGAVAILIDKENALNYSTVETDKQLRELITIGI